MTQITVRRTSILLVLLFCVSVFMSSCNLQQKGEQFITSTAQDKLESVEGFNPEGSFVDNALLFISLAAKGELPWFYTLILAVWYFFRERLVNKYHQSLHTTVRAIEEGKDTKAIKEAVRDLSKKFGFSEFLHKLVQKWTR